MILDLFAGPGGWDQGAAMIGRHDTLGIELDAAACQTAQAAGHERIQADVAAHFTEPFTGLSALIASPPCQAWSMAGDRKGEMDRANCHILADRMAAGDDSTDWTEWEDPRSALVCQPVRWVRDLRPPVIALEEVPQVKGLWEHFARIFRGWGYSVWVKVLCAADYGVPQTRDRVILGASLLGHVGPPEPTHAAIAAGPDLFGDSRLPWVTMARALGWKESERLRHPRGSGMTERYGEREDRHGTEPAMTVTSKARSWVRMGNQPGATVRHIDEPAPTLLFGYRSNAVTWHNEPPPTREELEGLRMYAAGVTGEARPKNPELEPSQTLTGKGTAYWAYDRPSTVGSFRPDVVAGPGYRTTVSRQNAEGSVRVTPEEAGVLQSFPADYPWSGSRTKQFEQVGNAVPPLLAAHVLASLGLGSLPLVSAA